MSFKMKAILVGIITLILGGITALLLLKNNVKNTYTISFDSDGGSKIEIQIVNEGEKVIIPTIPTKEGFTFVGWYYNDEKFDFETEIYEDVTLKAFWNQNVTLNTYTVTFNTDGGNTISNQTVNEGEKIIKPTDPLKEGYIFLDWYFNDELFDFETIINSDIELLAKWKIDETDTRTKYTVTFNSDGGSSVLTKTVTEGTKVSKPTSPTRSGYTFVEWQLDGKSYNFNNPVNKNITLKAVWKKVNQYTVTFNSDGGSSVLTKTVIEGTKVSKPANPTRSGYTFVEWQLDGKSYNFNNPVNKNITLKAVWKKLNQYTVTFNSDGGSKVSAKTVTEGTKVSKPTSPTKSGYTFVEWQLDGKSYNFNNPVNKNITLKAVWKQNNYTFSVSKIDDYSPDRVLTVYENGNKISVKSIKYTDGVTLCDGSNTTVYYGDIDGETQLLIVLNSGIEVKATIK